MRIGLTRRQTTEGYDSLKYVYGTSEQVLQRNHDLVYLPDNYKELLNTERQECAENFVNSCDAILYGGYTIDGILEARACVGRYVPMASYLHGSMPRGAWSYVRIAPFLKTTDVLVANSTADATIAYRFFPDARVRLVPFAVDQTRFYPLSRDQKAEFRSQMGFSEQDKILLYPGRITLEKNVHTVLKIFSAVIQVIPNSHLILAGDTFDVAFSELGIHIPNLKRTLNKVARELGIPTDHVRFLGRVEADRLRNLYNIADVAINMTLHHDENFGYAQTEAMACGTPVVGTSWGGLKDTIADGITGYQVRTVLSCNGVKVDWWAAVNKIVRLLRDDTLRQRFGQQCLQHISQHYGLPKLQENLEAVITELTTSVTCRPQSVKSSPFASEFWATCFYDRTTLPSYARGKRAFQLYQHLIEPYTQERSACPSLLPDDCLYLAAPISRMTPHTLIINDPLYPFEVDIPEEFRHGATLCIEALSQVAILTGDARQRLALQDTVLDLDLLTWMVETGILLHARSTEWDVAPHEIGPQVNRPWFTVAYVDHCADIVVLR